MKTRIYILLGCIFISSSVVADIAVLSTIGTGSTNMTWALADASEIKGTPKQVANALARTNLPAARRTEGMTCYQIDTATEWRLVGGTNNSNWRQQDYVTPETLNSAVATNNFSSLTLGGVDRYSWPLESKLQVYPMLLNDPVTTSRPQRSSSIVIVSNGAFNTFPAAVYNPQTYSVQAYYLDMVSHASPYASVNRAVSYDNGHTWQTPTVALADGGVSNNSYMYFAPIRMPDGRLFAAVSYLSSTSHPYDLSIDDWHVGYSWSTNDGVNWSHPVELTNPVGTNIYGTNTWGVALGSLPVYSQRGKLIVPAFFFRQAAPGVDQGEWYPGAYTSSDFGLTWTWAQWSNENISEVAVVETFDKRLVGLFRWESTTIGTRTNRLFRGVSSDDGATWSALASVDVNQCTGTLPPAAFTVVGNKWLLATRTDANSTGLFQSYDEGATWTQLFTQYPMYYNAFQMGTFVTLGGGKLGFVYGESSHDPYFTQTNSSIFFDVLDSSIPTQTIPASTNISTPFAAYMQSSLAGKANGEIWVDSGYNGESLTNAAAPPMVHLDGNLWFNGTNQNLVAQDPDSWKFLHDGSEWTIVMRLYHAGTAGSMDPILDTCNYANTNAGIHIARSYGPNYLCLSVSDGAGHWLVNECLVSLPVDQWTTIAVSCSTDFVYTNPAAIYRVYRTYVDGNPYYTHFTNGYSASASSPAYPLTVGSKAGGSLFSKMGVSDLLIFKQDIGLNGVASWTQAIQKNRDRNTAPTTWRSNIQAAATMRLRDIVAGTNVSLAVSNGVVVIQ